MEKTVQIYGVTVKVDLKYNNRVYFMSDWARVWDFVKDGHFTAVTYKHLMGHTDFFLVEEKYDPKADVAGYVQDMREVGMWDGK